MGLNDSGVYLPFVGYISGVEPKVPNRPKADVDHATTRSEGIMNWEAISAIGEIVGAIAVVATLIYLVVEIRRGASATQAASVQAAAALDHEFLMAVGSDPITAKLWETYLSAPETLPVDQARQGHFLMASLLRRLENVRIQMQLGTLSQDGWQSRQSMFNVIAGSSGYLAFLESPMARFLNEGFVKYMAQLKASQ